MAALGSLQHIFEHPLPESPTLLGKTLSSSWKQLKPVKVQPIEQSSVTEMFGELRFEQVFRHTRDENENIESTSSITTTTTKKAIHKKSFSLNYESLQVCTERIGSESTACVDETTNDSKRECQCGNEKIAEASAVMNKKRKYLHGDCRANRSRRSTSLGEFPPPITCLGKYGKPWVCFKSYRQDGRHVLKQVMIPTKEVLHACRHDGRLKLRFMQLKNKSTEQQQGSEEEEDESTEQQQGSEEEEDESTEQEQEQEQGSEEEEDESTEQEQGSEEEGLLTNDEIDEGEEQRQAT